MKHTEPEAHTSIARRGRLSMFRDEESCWDNCFIPFFVRQSLMIEYGHYYAERKPFYSEEGQHALLGVNSVDTYAIYLLGKKIGQGGGGSVWRAQNLDSGGIVVVKIIAGFCQPDVYIKPEKTGLDKLGRLMGDYEIHPRLRRRLGS